MYRNRNGFVECNLPEDISQDQLLNEIDKLNKDKILMEYYYNARFQNT